MYRISEFAERLGVAAETLRDWHKKGILVPAFVTPTGQRLYSDEQLDDLLGKRREEREFEGYDGLVDAIVCREVSAVRLLFRPSDETLAVLERLAELYDVRLCVVGGVT